MTRVPRFDYAARIDFDALAPSPGIATARETPQGLRVSAFLARDGLLEYSDGEQVWVEYRPRSELVAAAQSFALTPVTDTHPRAMVDSHIWADVVRGLVVSNPSVTHPIDGVSYLQADLLIGDAGLIQQMRDGRDQLSIGFTSEVVPTRHGRADDGTRCDAVQTVITGNHVANVAIGRAGPACRVFLDSAAWTVQNTEEAMQPKNQAPAKPEAKGDQLGTPMDMVPYALPDGSVVQVPTTVVAMLESMQMELAQLRAAMSAQESSPEGEEAPAPPAPPAAPDPEQDQFGAEEEEEMDTMGREREESAKKPAKAPAGVRLDSAAAKAFIAQRMPWVKLDEADDAALAVLFKTAMDMPAKETEEPPKPAAPKVDTGENPFQQPAPVGEQRADAHDVKTAEFLQRQGYKA